MSVSDRLNAAAERLRARNAIAAAPRCGSCVFWKAGRTQFWKTSDHSKPPAFGECTAARAPKVLLRADGHAPARMITRDDFGCVQWGAKP